MSASIHRRPEVAALATALIAWTVLFGLPLGSPTSLVTASSTPFLEVTARTLALAWPLWILMAAAMMVPATLPAIRHVSENSFRWRRLRAMGEFLVSYIAVWSVAGVVALTAVMAWHLGSAPSANSTQIPLLASLLIAAAWQVTPWKRGLLRGCQKSIPLAPHGWKASWSCVRFGSRYGLQCIGSCWALMLVMATTPTGHTWWALALTAVVVGERMLLSVRRRPHLVAAAAVIAAVMVALVGPDPAPGQTSAFCVLQFTGSTA